MEAVHYTHRRLGMSSDGSKIVSSMIRYWVAKWTLSDLRQAPSIKESDRCLVRIGAEQLAYSVSKLNSMGDAVLRTVKNLAEDVIATVNSKKNLDEDSLHPPPLISLGNGKHEYEDFSGFERILRVTTPGMGPKKLPREFVSVLFDRLPKKVEDFESMLNALRICNELCLQLTNQESIKHPKILQMALIQHVVTELVPIPQPPSSIVDKSLKGCSNNPLRPTRRCLWDQPMKLETKREILFLTHKLAEHFATASLSVLSSSSLDGARIVVTTCLWAYMDVMFRTIPSDESSVVFDVIHDEKNRYTLSVNGMQNIRNFESYLMCMPRLALAQSAVREYFEAVSEHDRKLQRRPIKGIEMGIELVTRIMKELGMDVSDSKEVLQQYAVCIKEDPEDPEKLRHIPGTLMYDYPELRILRDLPLVLKRANYHPTGGLLRLERDAAEIVHKIDKGKVKSSIPGLDQIGTPPTRRGSKADVAYYIKRTEGVKKCETEDDVLYTRDLPTFENKIFGQDCELLLSYLTVPYMRIPLVLGFFSTPERVRALQVPELRDLLESVVFEPGRWISPKNSANVPTAVPANPIEIGTSNGLLLSELSRSPRHVTGSLVRLLRLAADARDGKYNSNGALILYFATRMAARIEGFMQYLINLSETFKFGRKKKRSRGVVAAVASNIWSECEKSCLQLLGYCMDCPTEDADPEEPIEEDTQEVKALKEAREELREAYETLDIYETLSKWAEKAISAKQWIAGNRCQVHIALLYAHMSTAEYVENPEHLKRFLASSFYVLTRHTFGARSEDNEEIDFPESEFFYVLQQQRLTILSSFQSIAGQSAGLQVHKDLNEVLNHVLETVLEVSGENEEKLEDEEEEKPQRQLVADSKKTNEPSRRWVQGRRNARAIGDDSKGESESRGDGRFCAETVSSDGKVLSQTEVLDLMCWQLTVGAENLRAVDKEIVAHTDGDFQTVFGRATLQCAEKEVAKFCTTLAIIGRKEGEYELKHWAKDESGCKELPWMKRPYTQGTVKKHEKWVLDVFPPCEARRGVWNIHYKPGKSGGVSQWFMPIKPLAKDANICLLTGQHAFTYRGESVKILREALLHKSSGLVEIFAVFKSGRRERKTLCWASDGRRCLGLNNTLTAGMFNSNERGTYWPTELRYESGNKNHCIPYFKTTSITIKRLLKNKASEGWEQYIPARNLRGLLPDALVESYRFWQVSSDDLVGEMIGRQGEYKIYVKMMRQLGKNGDAALYDEKERVVLGCGARIMRIPINDDGKDPTIKKMTLLDIQKAPKDSPLHSIQEVLCQIESLSHILVWTYEEVKEGSECKIDLIELPRMELTFRIDDYGDGPRLYSVDLGNKFVSNYRSELSNQMVNRIPHALILEDSSQKRSLLVPNIKFMRPCVKGQPFSSQVYANPYDWEWNKTRKMPYFLYRIHTSESFLYTTTLSSNLYLLALRFANREYHRAFALSESLVVDGSLTKEEKLIITVIESFKDPHPNAHAVRLKIKCGLSSQFELKEGDVLGYISKRSHISANCRLTLEDEQLVMRGGKTAQVTNRSAYLAALERKGRTVGQSSSSWPTGTGNWTVVPQLATWEERKTLTYSESSKLQKEKLDYKAITGNLEDEVLVDTIHSLWGMSLDGSDNFQKGWLFLYTLLIQETGCSIAGVECGHAVAGLLYSLSLTMQPKTSNTFLGYPKKIIGLLCALRAGDCVGTNWSENAKEIQDPKHPLDKKKKITPIYMGVESTPPRFLCRSFKGAMRYSSPLSTFKYYTNQQEKMDSNSPVWQLLWRVLRWTSKMQGRGKFPNFKRLSSPSARVSVPAYATVSVTWNPREWASPHLVNCQLGLRQIPSQIRINSQITVDSKEFQAFATKPLGDQVDLKKYTDLSSGKKNYLKEMPFNIESDSRAKNRLAQGMLTRITTDINMYAKKMKVSRALKIATMPDQQMEKFAKGRGNPSKAIGLLKELRSDLVKARAEDRETVNAAISELLTLANKIDTESKGGTGINSVGSRLRFSLRQLCESEVKITIHYLVGSVISARYMKDVQALNPYLSQSKVERLMHIVTVLMLYTCRIDQTNWALEGLESLVYKLSKCKNGGSSRPGAAELIKEADGLAMKISNARHYFQIKKELNSQIRMNADDTYAANVALQEKGKARQYFDPRYLVSEYALGFLLRKKQVRLIRTFMEYEGNKKSRVEQMIMGAGKTTVVGPMLALMCADGHRFVIQIVPIALLEMSRAVMRERFSVIIRKPIMTLSFTRTARKYDDQIAYYDGIFNKLSTCVKMHGVCCSTPTSVKSVMIKYVEHLYNCGINPSNDKVAQNSRQLASSLKRIVQLFRTGVTIMDEVDMVLHPLRSELNFPIGAREPIDFLNKGYRYKLPMFLFDAFLYAQHGQTKYVPSFNNSTQYKSILDKIMAAVKEGCSDENSAFQQSPHLVLLNNDYYMTAIRPLLAEWMLLWLEEQHFHGLEKKHTLIYIIHGPQQRKDIADLARSSVKGVYMKMLNLTHDWLNIMGPHCLSMINRVKFGILTTSDVDRLTTLYKNCSMTLSRKLCAVPFVGKDVPSRSSEFAHPDIIIGLTILAYRYDGLRRTNFDSMIQCLRQEMKNEAGGRNLEDTDSSRRFVRWIELAGARVRGHDDKKDYEKGQIIALKKILKNGSPDGSIPPEITWNRWQILDIVHEKKKQKNRNKAKMRGYIRCKRIGPMNLSKSSGLQVQRDFDIENLDELNVVVPLHLLDVLDEEVLRTLFTLFGSLPQTVDWFLDVLTFTRVLRAQQIKLSACGQELGGDMLFQTRMGFSGTPSDLVPLELSCGFERGADAQMLYNLTSPLVMERIVDLPKKWTVMKLLKGIREQNPPCSALIDTGALITGYSNEEVARILLQDSKGLVGMDGVVFLDEFDRKMVLVRRTGQVVGLKQSGMNKSRRFSFYDQVHTTGMDIKQALNARAIITLGKDMSFRDYAQGAYRMRGIGKGQTFEIYVIPEVKEVIRREVTDRKTVKMLKPSGLEKRLEEICAWLVLNQLKIQKTQFQQLCVQNIQNVLRKRAFGALLENPSSVPHNAYKRLEKGEFKDTQAAGRKSNFYLAKSLDLLRQPINFDIADKVPDNENTLDLMNKEIEKWKAPFMLDSNGRELKDDKQQIDGVIKGLESLSQSENVEEGKDQSNAKKRSFQGEMVQEQEIEQESRKEEEREREIEIEKYRELAYSRDNEEQKAWQWSRLADPNQAGLDYKKPPEEKKQDPIELKAKPQLRFHDFSLVLGNKLLQHDKTTPIAIGNALKAKVVGLYFSASWCKPCQNFTPKLVKAYEALKKRGEKFEIVLVSGDKNIESFHRYRLKVPGFSIPMEGKNQMIKKVMNHFNCSGYPTLIILNGLTGNVICGNARGAVARDPEGNKFPWGNTSDVKSINQLDIKRPKQEEAMFYEASKFHLLNKKPLKFNDQLYFSENYYRRAWSLVSERRLKNVCIMLEWIPDVFAVEKENESKGTQATTNGNERKNGAGAQSPKSRRQRGNLSPRQRNFLEKAFEALDLDGNGTISSDEVVGLVRALNRAPQIPGLMESTDEKLMQRPDRTPMFSLKKLRQLMERMRQGDEVKEHASQEEKLLQIADVNRDGQISFDELVGLIEKGSLNEMETGRYFVCLSLAEAESIRRIIHLRRERGMELVDNMAGSDETSSPNVALALWVMDFAIRDRGVDVGLDKGGMLLEHTSNYFKPPRSQRDFVIQTLRFFNGDMFFSDYEAGVLIKSLKMNSEVERRQFFEDTIGRRRRSRTQVMATPLAITFTVPDEYYLMGQRAMRQRVRNAILSKGFLLRDAFKKFDHDSNGYLSPAELHGAFEYLEIAATPGEILLFLESIDKDENGRVDIAEFLEQFGAKDEVEVAKEQKLLTDMKSTDNKELDLTKVTPKELISTRAESIAIVHVSRKSMGSVSVLNVSGSDTSFRFWAPKLKKSTKSGRDQTDTICFGYNSQQSRYAYVATVKGTKPARARILYKFFPTPLGFTLLGKQSGLYIWKPVVPDKQYLAIGLVATSTKEEPSQDPRTCPIRVIRKDLCRVVSAQWKKISVKEEKTGKGLNFWYNTDSGLVISGKKDINSLPALHSPIPGRTEERVFVENREGFSVVAHNVAKEASDILDADPTSQDEKSRQNVELALRKLHEAIQLDPDREEYKVEAARALNRLNQPVDALDQIMEVMAESSRIAFSLKEKLVGNVKCWLVVVDSLMRLGRISEAKDATEMALREHKANRDLNSALNDVKITHALVGREWEFVYTNKILVVMKELPFDLNVGFNSKRGILKFMPDGSVTSTANFGGVGLGNVLHLFGGSRTGFWSTSLNTPKNIQIEFASEEKTHVLFDMDLIEENVWSSHPNGLNALKVEEKRENASPAEEKQGGASPAEEKQGGASAADTKSDEENKEAASPTEEKEEDASAAEEKKEDAPAADTKSDPADTKSDS